MFSDPQTVTVNSVAKVMPKTASSGESSTYKLADGTYQFEISHSESKQRIRSMVRITQRAIVTNPLDSTDQDYDNLVFYVVLDRPVYGFTSTDAVNLITGFKTWLDSTAIGKLYGRES
jgi:hypothetical protein